MTTLTLDTLMLPGSLVGENPFPVFRDRDRVIHFTDDVPAQYRELAGWNTGNRVLPYLVQDRYDRKKQPTPLQVAVLENDTLKATFLLQMGGRLLSLFHKPAQRELLSRNPVFQPANLAIRNAWFSGGIEWNAGQYGHTVFTCSPVFAAQIAFADGTPGLRLYEFERMKKLFWQTDFYLPHDSAQLIAYTRIANPYETEASMYWWTNIAVPESEDVRVIAPATQSLYHDPKSHGFGLNELPALPTLNGGDGTYSTNSPFANEFFMQCEAAEMPFITALDKAGSGLFEASTPRLNARKLFCWGMSQGGRHWQDYLAQPGIQYIEIQCGLAPTQIHGSVMPAKAQWDWTEAFGLLEVDPQAAHGEWAGAVRAAGAGIQQQLPLQRLSDIEAQCRTLAEAPSSQMLQAGAGWGALEMARLHALEENGVPASFVFPAETFRGEPARWLRLLQGGELEAPDPDAPIGAYLVQDEWRELLHNAVTHKPNWFAWLQWGVWQIEHFDEAGAAYSWQQSIALQPTAWAHRNLAKLCERRNQFGAAEQHYVVAWALAVNLGAEDRGALAGELLRLLIATKQFRKAASFHEGLPADVQGHERVQLAFAEVALALGHLDVVESTLQREFANIREGEVSLTDLWFRLWAQRDGTSVDEARKNHPAPKQIDFRGMDA
jgi:hypothetical protein